VNRGRGGMTSALIGNNPSLIQRRPASSNKLECGLQGTTRNLAMWSRKSLGTTPRLRLTSRSEHMTA
jgi:hypothetical protein